MKPAISMPRESKRRLIYLCLEGLPRDSRVLESQVITLLQGLEEEGLVFDLVVFEPLRVALTKSYLETRKALSRIRTKIKGRIFFRYITAASHTSGTYMVRLMLLLLILKDMLRKRVVLVHCRGQDSAFAAVGLKELYGKLRIVLDIRGEQGAEFLFSAERQGLDMNVPWVRKKYRRLKLREKQAIEKTDHILCVSRAFKRRLQSHYIIPDGKIDVIPCSANPDLFFYDEDIRQRIRRELGLANKLVITYSGSMYPWQLPDRIVEAFVRLKNRVSNLHFLLLTPVTQMAEKYLEGVAKADYTLLSVEHIDVPKYLMAADMGLLLRQRHPLNEVASPVKFAEYLMCGLPVMITRGIGDTAEVITTYRAGIVIENLDDEQKMVDRFVRFWEEDKGTEERRRISRVGTDLFSRKRYIPLLSKVYHALST